MSTLEILVASPPALELVITGAPSVEIALSAPVTLEVTSEGIQGARGFTGTQAFDQVASVLLGQTAFNLLLVPAYPAKVRMLINGTSYATPEISVIGQQVTWAEPFTLEPTDTVEFQYPVQETP